MKWDTLSQLLYVGLHCRKAADVVNKSRSLDRSNATYKDYTRIVSGLCEVVSDGVGDYYQYQKQKNKNELQKLAQIAVEAKLLYISTQIGAVHNMAVVAAPRDLSTVQGRISALSRKANTPSWKLQMGPFPNEEARSRWLQLRATQAALKCTAKPEEAVQTWSFHYGLASRYSAKLVGPEAKGIQESIMSLHVQKDPTPIPKIIRRVGLFKGDGEMVKKLSERLELLAFHPPKKVSEAISLQAARIHFSNLIKSGDAGIQEHEQLEEMALVKKLHQELEEIESLIVASKWQEARDQMAAYSHLDLFSGQLASDNGDALRERAGALLQQIKQQLLDHLQRRLVLMAQKMENLNLPRTSDPSETEPVLATDKLDKELEELQKRVTEIESMLYSCKVAGGVFRDLGKFVDGELPLETIAVVGNMIEDLGAQYGSYALKSIGTSITYVPTAVSMSDNVNLMRKIIYARQSSNSKKQ